LQEAEDLLEKTTDPSLKSNATETLTGLRNNLNLGTMDNNGIMAEAEKLLALLQSASSASVSSTEVTD
jgi:pneumococcal histidine triad protein A, putative